MPELTKFLKLATRAIESDYFNLSIDGGNPIYRERVYCYELYHQLRLLWPNGSDFFLHGEVDKAGHPKFKPEGIGRLKPDLIVHQPGRMEGNYAVIEVKSTRAKIRGFRKDIETLLLFRSLAGYIRLIYLIFGDDPRSRLIQRLEVASKQIAGADQIEVWHHAAPGMSAIRKP